MLILRSTLFNLLMIVFTAIYSILLLITRPFGFAPAWFWARAWSATILACARLICGIRLVVEGREHLPHEACVVMAKHQSAFETIAMPILIPPFTWVLKFSLYFIPLFGWVLWVLRGIAVRRGHAIEALKDVLNQGKRFLKKGRWIVIFPEGERVKPGTTGNYQASGVMLAKQAGVGILPMAHNAGLCWPKRSYIKYPVTVRIRCLPFIPPEVVAATPRNELLERLKLEIERNTRELGG